MYGYTPSTPHSPAYMVETWEIADSFDGTQPRCNRCGQKTDVYTSGENSTVVCVSCNVAARLNTRSLNQGLARAHRLVFPISPNRRW